MRRLTVLGVALALVLALGACGGSGIHKVRSIAITATRALSLPPVVRRPSAGPGPGQVDVAFTDARTGFVLDSAGIQRTRDSGRSWATVWRRHGIPLGAIAAAGETIVATGEDARFRPVLVRSTDGGATWAVLRPAVPGPEAGYWFALRPRLISPSLAFMVLNDDIYNPPLPGRVGSALLRSTDGGRDWSAPHLPGRDVFATGGLAFTGPNRGFVTGFSGFQSGRCNGEIFATGDAGLTWRPVPRTCVRTPLESLSFPSPSVGYAAGAPTDVAASSTPLTLLVSNDGGVRWSRRFESLRASGNPPPVGSFAQIDFPDSSHGYALLSGCPMGANGLCAGTVWVTQNGGFSWRDTNQTGTDLFVAGRRDAWLVAAPAPLTLPEPNGDFLSSSTDGGRSWTPHGRASSLALVSLLASGSRLYARTAAGELESDDGGVHWRGGSDPALAAIEGQLSYGLAPPPVTPSGFAVATTISDPAELLVSGNGGRTLSQVRPAAFAHSGVAAVAFSDHRNGLAFENRISTPLACVSEVAREGRPIPLPRSFTQQQTPPSAVVLATKVGPDAWRAVSTLPINAAAVAYADTTAVVLGAGCGASANTGNPGEEVAISRNSGRTWSVQGIPGSPFPCAPQLADRTVAILCSGDSGSQLLVSQNAGRTWTAYKTAAPLRNLGLAATRHRLWLSGPPGALWTSSDAGASWTSEPLAFNP